LDTINDQINQIRRKRIYEERRDVEREVEDHIRLREDELNRQEKMIKSHAGGHYRDDDYEAPPKTTGYRYRGNPQRYHNRQYPHQPRGSGGDGGRYNRRPRTGHDHQGYSQGNGMG